VANSIYYDTNSLRGKSISREFTNRKFHIYLMEGQMTLFYYLAVALLVLYGIYFIYKSEKQRETELNLHLLQAKQILDSHDLKDKRSWFISKFNEAETHLIDAQASCGKEFDYQAIRDIREQLNKIKSRYKN